MAASFSQQFDGFSCIRHCTSHWPQHRGSVYVSVSIRGYVLPAAYEREHFTMHCAMVSSTSEFLVDYPQAICGLAGWRGREVSGKPGLWFHILCSMNHALSGLREPELLSQAL